MGYLGRRIGLSQDKGDSTPGGADGAVGGGILDLLASGYFERQDKIYNAPGAQLTGHTATGGVISDYTDPGSGNIYRAHIFTSSGTFNVTETGTFGDTVEYLVVAGGGGGVHVHGSSGADARHDVGRDVCGELPWAGWSAGSVRIVSRVADVCGERAWDCEGWGGDELRRAAGGGSRVCCVAL